jgi:hypothetical protein
MDLRRLAHIVLGASLIVPALLILLWIIGLFAVHVGGLIHLLLVLAMVIAPAGILTGIILLAVSGRK